LALLPVLQSMRRDLPPRRIVRSSEVRALLEAHWDGLEWNASGISVLRDL
jgi:hypothetical protein